MVVRKLDVRKLFSPDPLELVDDHCQHLGHRVVHRLNPAFGVWVIGAGGKIPSPEEIIEACESFQQTVGRTPRVCFLGISRGEYSG